MYQTSTRNSRYYSLGPVSNSLDSRVSFYVVFALALIFRAKIYPCFRNNEAFRIASRNEYNIGDAHRKYRIRAALLHPPARLQAELLNDDTRSLVHLV